MEISKMLTLSTSHVTDATLKSLDTEAEGNNYPCLGVYKKEDFGYFIYIDKDQYIQSSGGGDMPSDLRTVISFTIEAGCDILCLDSDGPELVCIPHYEYAHDRRNGIDGSQQLCFCGGELIGKTFVNYRV